MKNLLITTVGEYNHLQSWIKDRDFDIALVNYDYSMDINDALKVGCIYYDSFPVFKYPGIWQMMTDAVSLQEYDYYFMPDEDIDISGADINRLFQKMKEHDLWLAQPAIEKSNKSFPSWEMFIHKEGLDIVYTDFVEVMCPAFNNKAIKMCLDTFNKSHSGWGLDLTWAKILKGQNMGIVNDVVARHTRPVKGGNLYEALQKLRISPYREKRKLMQEYGVSSSEIKSYGYLSHSIPARQGAKS